MASDGSGLDAVFEGSELRAQRSELEKHAAVLAAELAELSHSNRRSRVSVVCQRELCRVLLSCCSQSCNTDCVRKTVQPLLSCETKASPCYEERYV